MSEQERPASTCKRCGQLPGDGTAICDDCRDSRTVAEALLGNKARDASVDAPDWEQAAHDRAIVIIGKNDEINRLRAELAALQKEKADDAWQQGWLVAVQERDEARAELTAAHAEIARLKARNEFVEREWAAEIKIRKASDVCAALSSRLNEQLTAATAKLGRAVTALRWLLSGDLGLRCYCHDDEICGLHKAYAARDDAGCTEAAAYVSALEAVYEAAKRFRDRYPAALGGDMVFSAALAAVDAQRGAVKP